MAMYIWQQKNWPEFTWDNEVLAPLLRQVHFGQGQLLGASNHTPQSDVVTLDTLLANILHSSEIEGEKLNAFSVRSSLAHRLGVREVHPCPTTEKTEGLAEMTVDAITHYEQPLTQDRLFRWHALLFPSDDSLVHPIQGGMLRGKAPMQVVSGRFNRPIIHFEAPPRELLDQELIRFLDWFESSRHQQALDPLVRAGIAHLWFVTLHPFEDGNGRITRLLTDMALAQAEHRSIRLYAMSVSIQNHRRAYYDMLEHTQKGDVDITPWLAWFLETLNDAISDALSEVTRTMARTRYWQHIDRSCLSKEQIKVLGRMLDGDFSEGINNRQYQSVAKVSSATATRHLAQLVTLGCIESSSAGGRSRRYIVRAM